MKTNISQIGFFAQQVLERSKGARVSGIASRGIYLQPENDLTLYLSLEEFPGPLTLNFEEGSTRVEKIRAGFSARFKSGEIFFPDENIYISLEGCKIWNSPQVEYRKGLYPQGLDTALSLAKNIASENPYLPLLFENPEQIPGAAVIGERIQNLQIALKTGVSEKITAGSIKLLGLGPGLTPLGDDFLLGVLLTFNRWGHIFSPALPEIQKGVSPAQSIVEWSSHPNKLIKDLNQIILENTRLKTTQISASLLACAAEGAADERLITVLDGFFSSGDLQEEDIHNLLKWGHSSGMAVLGGMISVLRTKDTVS